MTAVSRFVAIMAALSCGGCATVLAPSNDRVAVGGSPVGATVTVNGEYRGQTPLSLELSRDRDHHITVSADGYEAASCTITHSLSWGWVIADLLLFWPGLLVDAVTGDWMSLDSEECVRQLRAVGVAIR